MIQLDFKSFKSFKDKLFIQLTVLNNILANKKEIVVR